MYCTGSVGAAGSFDADAAGVGAAVGVGAVAWGGATVLVGVTVWVDAVGVDATGASDVDAGGDAVVAATLPANSPVVASKVQVNKSGFISGQYLAEGFDGDVEVNPGVNIGVCIGPRLRGRCSGKFSNDQAASETGSAGVVTLNGRKRAG